MKKILLAIGSTLLICLAGFYILNSYIYNTKQADEIDSTISSYDECIAAGYASLDSYPEQCETADGKRFVRNLPEDELEEAASLIEAVGTIVCLKHWDTSGPVTLECAIGFKDVSGNYYVLRDSDSFHEIGGSFSADVRVTGRLVPGSHEKYRSLGTIEVESVTEL